MNEFDAVVEVLEWLRSPGPREAAVYRALLMAALVVLLVRRRE